MLVYLDMCCLKRPFDDQSQPRIRLESEAVLALLALQSADVQFVHSPALLLENSLNPIAARASRVAQWLLAQPPAHTDRQVDTQELEQRTTELIGMGFKNFDALHVASAEQARADVLATCDDRLLAIAARNRERLKIRVAAVVELAREMIK